MGLSILPPPLELLPGLFAPSATFGAARERHAEGMLDAACLTLGELVSRVADGRPDRATVLVPREDPAAALRIAERLTELGMRVEKRPLEPVAPRAAPGLVLLPDEPPDAATLAAAVRAAAAVAGGAHGVRLAFATPRVPRDAEDGASWAARHGLDDPRWREALTALVQEALPHARVPLHAAIGFQDLAIHPLCESFAGNGLVERNAELLQNVVP